MYLYIGLSMEPQKAGCRFLGLHISLGYRDK